MAKVRLLHWKVKFEAFFYPGDLVALPMEPCAQMGAFAPSRACKHSEHGQENFTHVGIIAHDIQGLQVICLRSGYAWNPIPPGTTKMHPESCVILGSGPVKGIQTQQLPALKMTVFKAGKRKIHRRT
jgi:hypothetical protein